VAEATNAGEMKRMLGSTGVTVLEAREVDVV
jgi:hypothetical protein